MKDLVVNNLGLGVCNNVHKVTLSLSQNTTMFWAIMLTWKMKMLLKLGALPIMVWLLSIFVYSITEEGCSTYYASKIRYRHRSILIIYL